MQISFVGGNSVFEARLADWLETNGWLASGVLHDQGMYLLNVFETKDEEVVRAIHARLTARPEDLAELEEAIFPRGLKLTPRHVHGKQRIDFIRARQEMPMPDRKIAMLAKDMATDPAWW
jgi:hypothetical protein